MTPFPSPPPFLSAAGPSERAALEAALLLEDEAPQARGPSAATGAWTVLVADPDADTRRYVGRCLRAGGLPRPLEVVEAADGAEARRLLRTRVADLVVADLHVPGLDGAALVALLAEDAALAGLPVLFLSGEADVAPGLLGATRHFLRKPFNGRRLAAAVRALLGSGPPA